MSDFTELEFGIDTFGDLPLDDHGAVVSYGQAIRATLEEAVLADDLGIDAIAIGEHHRPEFAISSPETVLAGIATATERIRLGSGVTVLSSDDPVRVFQRFATVDALSHGRAEVILGRGSFTESFPLFGYDLSDYEVLFDEKIDLFHALLDEKPVTWEGTTRAALHEADVFPKTDSGRLRTWVGVGGTPQSVVRTAQYGFRLMLAIIGGAPARFAPYVDLYRRAAQQLGTTAYPVGMHSPGFIAETDAEAREIFYPGYKVIRDRIGALRGWPPVQRSEFEADVERGSLYIGSPETVARKMADAIRALDVGRFDLIYTAGGALAASARLRAVELYGTKVVPMVRELLAESPARSVMAGASFRR
ncbi:MULTISPECIES: LLM class flavin-dependent oxidoreductase [unclassified Microbacterium]|uniref:LLM class flavin-dependent oxidoreductase n=1 Tax=unclassified Microbacterium TaxID=2609290 RepID=UPI00214B28B4|nr:MULTISPECIES: LLM class flavin-dependent oxidoreductase [unclassified Microbacterium]MCR2810893.1 LLM class flavin-dependent oxidoreductase [Microbacterium sp. zg.B185]WIM19704.1 LLM class flavin-dependent oxidoreductase [Microbacterium sp. zg-B185]